MAKIKNPSIEAIMANIEKKMGTKPADKVLFRYGDKPADQFDVISFGYPAVDEASNCGGIAKGKVIEIFGQESGGKSFLSLKLIATAQKMGLVCCLVDAEQSFQADWAKKHGVDVDNLIILNEALSAEKILDYVVAMCSEDGVGLVVVDSTAALTPQKELEGSVSDQDYALLARAMSKALRKIVSGCGKTKTTCVFLNQIREKMGVMFGNPETTPGGRALRFYAHQRIMVTPGKNVKVQDGDKEKVIARKSYVKFVKNKTAAPMGEGEIEIVFFEEAMNPVVKFCNVCKDAKLIGQRNGKFQIKKDVLGAKSNLDTDTSTVIELADYVVKNDYVNSLIEAYENLVKEGEVKNSKYVTELKENPSLITSPLAGKAVKLEDIKTDEKLNKSLSVDVEESEADATGGITEE